ERGLAGLETRLELGVQALDARVFQHELEPLLQRVDVQRGPSAASDPLLEITGTEPAVPLHRDAGETALDDLKGDHAVDDVLIREDRSGVNVAVVDVEPSQGEAGFLQILRRE